MTSRIATVQAEAWPGDVAHNVHRAAQLTAQAAAARASVVVFPEAFPTGYDTAVFARPLPDLDDTAWLAPIQHVVDDTGIIAIVNTALDRGDRRTLTDVVLAPRRAPLAAYDKQHLHAPERETFTAGGGGFSFEVDGTCVALSVCYDANFPEHAAAAAASGATVYVNSGAYFPGGERRRDLHYASRALDNGMYVVFSGLVGAPYDFIGGSAVFDPLGRRVASVQHREGIAVVDIDPELIATVRDDQRMWRDRRPDLGPHRHLDDLALDR
ncbi:carbon-nitrogen hydrolase family protein [Microbacterium sp. KSW2-29]|uniref:Carbon-nitrogen hydrolase family protein n=1 Tax=Microbacterium phycohabitans TaxID=3075993 RepID=A0ABU3SMC7_9MICO|nr:carbon-nitrogen hydrolase family protein [Microbacterium sp. KSW2-29]MDU0345831.1 carbon-nitrogen hydrolase family protein [Microbacterium sp. KSW2-29]